MTSLVPLKYKITGRKNWKEKGEEPDNFPKNMKATKFEDSNLSEGHFIF